MLILPRPIVLLATAIILHDPKKSDQIRFQKPLFDAGGLDAGGGGSIFWFTTDSIDDEVRAGAEEDNEEYFIEDDELATGAGFSTQPFPFSI